MISKDELTPNERTVLQSEAHLCGRSLGFCYLLALGGHLGIHRFYMKRNKSAALQLLLFVLAATAHMAARTSLQEWNNAMLYYGMMAVCVILFGGLTVWVIVDLFLLPGMVKCWNARVERDLMAQIIAMRRSNP